jgi:hypothetical protein
LAEVANSWDLKLRAIEQLGEQEHSAESPDPE